MVLTSARRHQLVVAVIALVVFLDASDAARYSTIAERPHRGTIRGADPANSDGVGQGGASADQPCGVHDDEVCSLPGLNGIPHVRMRSGYITVSEVSDRRLWYLVADRERDGPDQDQDQDNSAQHASSSTTTSSSFGKRKRDHEGEDEGQSPVLLWLTGGPGCSSLDAFIYEHGPFKFSYAPGGAEEEHMAHVDTSGAAAGQAAGGAGKRQVLLQPNPHSWTKLATVIYVDSPAGTGMSYSGRPNIDYHTNDEYTIADLITFLRGLTDRYPELATRPFFIAGESYGGVFVPMLARELVRVNKELRKEGKQPLVELTGYAIGNPVTDDVIDGNAQMFFAADMGFVDPPTWRHIRAACDDMFWNATRDTECYDAQGVVKDDLWDLNWYDILDPCVRPDDDLTSDGSASGAAATAKASRSAAARDERFFWPYTARMQRPGLAAPQAAAPELEAALEPSRRGGRRLWGPWLRHVAPCMDRRIALDWLNREEVRSALHAAPASSIGGWQPCSDVLYYRLDTMELVPVHEELVREGLRVLVYSGDHDMVVPHTGTRKWVYDVAKLGSVDGPLRPWNYNGQVAGFTARFSAGAGLRFATVKGAGHMVPQSKPALALRLLEAFFDDEEL